MHIPAIDIIRDAYNASERTDIDYTSDDIGLGAYNGTATMTSGSTAFVLSAELEYGRLVGYTWTTYDLIDSESGVRILGEDISTDGGPTDQDARAALAAWLTTAA